MIEIDIHKKLKSSTGEFVLKIKKTIEAHSFLAVTGPSGAGKTSLLRILAGLLNPDDGVVKVNGVVWLDAPRKQYMRIQDRELGFVFQDYALFPNRTVEGNLNFALKKNQPKAIIYDLMETMDLVGLKDRKPGQLSGGQQQRVALARSLVQKPKLLLLDEPLSALDRTMRRKLQHYLAQLHKRFGLTTILVSHDIAEILTLADHVWVLADGEIVRDGKPSQLYEDFALSGKFQFVGEIVKITAQDVIFTLVILVNNELVKVVSDPVQAKTLKVGDQVVVASKAFNPVIKKV